MVVAIKPIYMVSVPLCAKGACAELLWSWKKMADGLLVQKSLFQSWLHCVEMLWQNQNMWDQPRSTSLVAEIPQLLVPGLAEQQSTWGSPAGPKYIIKRLCFSSSKANLTLFHLKSLDFSMSVLLPFCPLLDEEQNLVISSGAQKGLGLDAEWNRDS